MNKVSIRKDFLTFLRTPTYESPLESNLQSKIIILFKVLILTYIGLFISGVLYSIFEHFEVIKPFGMKMDKVYNSINETHSNFKPYFLLLAIVIQPIMEEISFRLPLTIFNDRFVQFSISLLSGQLMTFLLQNVLWWPSTSLAYFLISISYILIAGSIVFFFLNINRNWLESLKNYWERKPNVIIYASAVIFAVMHILNLEITISDLIFLPVILLPFFVFGISFSYLRIRLGFIYSITLHILITGIRFGLFEFVKH